MSRLFEELDYRQTPLGELILRRRRILKLDRDVVEVILNDEHLMSDMFTASETALATIPMRRLEAGGAEQVEIACRGTWSWIYGRGCARLQLGCVIDRRRISGPDHRMARSRAAAARHKGLPDDPRCRFVEGDFFGLARAGAGFDPAMPGRRFDGIFLDIDHSPEFHLNPSHADFYSDEGLARLSRSLKDAGIFALWSNDPPDEAFLARLAAQFASASAEEVVFHNPLLEEDCLQTVYIAIRD